MKRTHILSILLLLNLLLLAPVAQAATYYVATTGNDSNPGTQAQPFLTIQKGINTAVNGDTVLVASGTYTGTGNRNMTFNGKNFTLQSQGGSASTIIDCEGFAGNPGRGMHFVSAETPQAVLDGFTIKNGYINEVFGGGAGGGIVIQGASPTIRNCVLTNNTITASSGDAFGGGVHIQNSSPHLLNCTITNNSVLSLTRNAIGGGVAVVGNGSPTLTNCLLLSNRVTSDSGGHGIGAGLGIFSPAATLTDCTLSSNTMTAEGQQCLGGGVYVASSATFLRCTFTGNRNNGTPRDAEGGGAFLENGSSTFSQCTFSNNVLENGTSVGNGGGAYINSAATGIFTSCLFSKNRVRSLLTVFGGGIYNRGSATLTGCAFRANSAEDEGGALANFLSSPTVTNCTFVGNSAGRGGGISNNDSSPTVTNCTFSGNPAVQGPGMDSDERSNPTMTNCNLWGHEGYEIRGPAVVTYTNRQYFGDDPRFVRAPSPGSDNQWGTDDDDYGDLRLQANSPCINAGTASAPSLPAYDFLGLARIAGSAPDQGAYELGSTPYFADHLYVDKAAGSDTTGNGTQAAPFQTVNKALLNLSSPAYTAIHIKSGNYGTDRPRVTQKVKFVNWGNTGQARIGKP